MSSQAQSPSPSLPASLSLPSASTTVTISIINTTARIDRLPTSYHYPPSHIPPAFTHLNCPCFAFLIEHPPSGQKVLFDLGMRKDWQNLAPSIVSMIKTVGADIKVEKDVSEILEAGGIDLKDIDGIIWSHHHCDHTGSPALFPPSTTLHVGPGFQAAFTPGHPTAPSSPILEADYAGREIHEVAFSTSSPVVAGFRAHDFFGDGSFYLLDAPGHSEAHLCGLARTSAATEGEEGGYIFLGADCAHHPGEIRPSRQLPLPGEISLSDSTSTSTPTPITTTPLASLHRLSPSPLSSVSPFLICKDEVTHDLPETLSTIEKVQTLDARDDVLVVMAHDQSLVEVVRFWPERANGWRSGGWKERGAWGWVGDFL